jgi:hypothetical protein
MSKNIKPLTYSIMFILFIVTCYMVSNQPDATMNDLSPESRIELKYESLNDDKTY